MFKFIFFLQPDLLKVILGLIQMISEFAQTHESD